MMLDNTKTKGEKSELVAAAFLAGKGYEILETNWRDRHKEIDIIARHNNTLVIVEVKSRISDYGLAESPWESVTKRKQRMIVDAAETYIFKKNLNMETRFDVISIVWLGESPEIEHIEGAFYPGVE